MKFKYFTTIMVVSFCNLGNLATAQDSKQTSSDSLAPYLNMTFEELLSKKVTTGSFLELNLQEASVSMTIITAEQIESSGARHLTDALEIFVPGFQSILNKWNGILWGMRGVANDRNTKFIFLVNGHKMNTESRDGAITELDLGLLDDVERIEVLRGPAGLVYGSGAIAGVINVVTKQYSKDAVTASAKLQTWNMNSFGQESQVSVNQRLGEKTTIRVDVGGRKSEGVGAENSRVFGRPMFPYPQSLPNPPKEGVPSMGSAGSTPGNYKAAIDLNSGNLRMYSRWTHQVTNASGLFPLDAWPDIVGLPKATDSPRLVDGEMRNWDSFYANLAPSNGEGANRRQYVLNNISNQLSYTLPVGKNKISFVAGMDAVTNRIQLEDVKGFENQYSKERNTQVLETFGERRYNVGATYLLTSKPKFQLATGCQFSKYDIGSDMTGKNEVNERPKHLVVSNVTYYYGSFFSEGVYHFTDKLDGHAGVRYDLHTRTINQGGVVSPKVGLVYQINKLNSVKLIYQQSSNNGSADNYEFNRNSINDNGQTQEGSVYHYSDIKDNVIPPVDKDMLHQLKPERSQSIELMSFNHITKQLVVMPSISFNTISDIIAWNRVLYRTVNAGKYHCVNVDFDMQYSDKKITIGINHTYQQIVGMDLKSQEIITETPVFEKYNQSFNGTQWENTPKRVKTVSGADSSTYTAFNFIRDGITVDGKNFMNMASNISKVYVDYKPASWITLHASARIYWSLIGRKQIFDYTTGSSAILNPYSSALANAKDYPYLGIQNNPMFKVNLGVVLGGSESHFKVSVHVYDLLGGNGSSKNINSLRWQYAGSANTGDLFAVDYRSFAMKMAYTF